MSEERNTRRPRDRARRGFGAVVQRHRLRLGLSREELASRAGTTSNYLAKLETSHGLPRRDLLQRLAEALQLTAEELFDEAEQEGAVDEPHGPHDTWPRGRPTDPHVYAMDAEFREPPAASPPPPLPGWITGLQETLHGLPEERRETVGRHLMRYAQRLVEAEATGDRALEALSEVVRGVVLHVGERSGDELRKAWHVVLAYLREFDAEPNEVEVRRFLDVAYALAAASEPSGERVATLRPGTRKRVWLKDVGRDEQGHVWVDPLAHTRLAGADEAHPWVQRTEDGRVILDLSGLADEVDVGPRDPAKHRVRASLAAAP